MEGTGIEYALLTMFKDGGVMMYPLVLCSLLGLGVIIAKGYMLLVAQRRHHFAVDFDGNASIVVAEPLQQLRDG